jgi:RNA polymerase sigma-70 factor (family 1)
VEKYFASGIRSRPHYYFNKLNSETILSLTGQFIMPTIGLPNEKDLLMQVADGDEAAYKKLFICYWDQIYSVALMFTKSREMSQDLTQDIFAHIWVKRESLRDVVKFNSFLFITARNIIIDRLRREVFTSKYEPRLVEYFSDPDHQPFSSMELKELEFIIQSGIAHLPSRQQTAFCLSRFSGLKHEEIAQQMGISRESVKSHIVRAISALKKHFSLHTAGVILFAVLVTFIF